MKKFFAHLKEAMHLSKNNAELKKIKLSHLKFLAPYMRTYWRKAISASLLVLLLSILALPIPYLMKILIDEAFIQKKFSTLNSIILIMLGVQFLRVAASFFMNYLFTVLSQEVMLSVRKDLFHRILKLPLSFFDKNQTGYLLSRIGEVGGLRLLFSSSIAKLFTGLLEFVVCLGALFYLHWPIGIIAVAIIPIYYMTVKFFSSGLQSSSQQLFEKNAAVTKNIQESLSGINEIKVFAAENKEATKIHKSLKGFLKINIIQSIFFSISSELILLIGTIGTYAVVWYSGFRIIEGELTIGDYVAFAGYLAKLFSPTQMIASLGLTLQPVSIALQRVSSLFKLITEEEEPNRNQKKSKLDGEIQFKNVSFNYEGRVKTLEDINVHVLPGETVAIVGPSGSGKTTIIRLILGLYKAKQGEILLDRHNIDNCILSEIRERIGIVSQNIFLFNDTVRNNIRYNYNTGDEEVLQAAKIADAHDFIMSFPEGYDTIIGENGTALSGGQIQRIAIARAILGNPDILIFDEATSHVDEKTEASIIRDIQNIFKGKTLIIITHRISSIKDVDNIFVLNNGKLSGQGKFHQLFPGKNVDIYKEEYNNIRRETAQPDTQEV